MDNSIDLRQDCLFKALGTKITQIDEKLIPIIRDAMDDYMNVSLSPGTELVHHERQSHFKDHNITPEDDAKYNAKGQLIFAAAHLILDDEDREEIDPHTLIPEDWDVDRWEKMWDKPFKERLIIAASLLIAQYEMDGA